MLYVSEDEIRKSWPGCMRVFTVSDMYDGPDHTEEITLAFLRQHRLSFKEVYEKLADDLSQKSFYAFLKAKYESDNEHILPYVVLPQYFFESAPWDPDERDILLDGGAYDGDSIVDFLRWNKGKYSKIVACEPDVDNCRRLLHNLKSGGVQNVEIVRKGLYREKAILNFASTNTMMSSISENGKTKLEVDSIDNILAGEKVSLIKMDIEGAEIDALLGARQTIQKWRPILMISAYHKRDDIYRIFQYINGIIDGYRFYFRCHKPLAIDAVLYAVPEERIVNKG